MSKVLIVEDNENIRIMLNAILSAKGYATALASNGIEGASELFNDPEINLVICDLMMPGSDGFDFLKRTSEFRKEGGVPVCILSALEDSKSIIKALESGADEYMVKPLDKEILIEKVAMLLMKGSENSFTLCPSKIQGPSSDDFLILGFSENEILVDSKKFEKNKGDVFELEGCYFNDVVGIKRLILKVGDSCDFQGKSVVSLAYIGLVENQRKKIRCVSIRGEEILDPDLEGVKEGV